jgi:hypothetical protein
MQRNPCLVCGGTCRVNGERCTSCEEGASSIISLNRIFILFPSTGGIILDVSLRQDHPADIIQDLRRELASQGSGAEPYTPEDRYAQVTIRGQASFLSLLRLMRWDIIFEFQEVTGLPWPRQFQHHWHHNEPRKMSRWDGPPDDNYSTMSAMEVAIRLLKMWGQDVTEESLRPVEAEVARILGRK